MYLLKKDNYEFNKILKNGYKVDEQEAVIQITQFANGKRKKIKSGYEDCIITLTFGGLDGNTTKEYITNLTDGEYEYWSIKNQAYKKANFLVTMPEQSMISALDEQYFDDFEVTLQKSSEVVVE